MEMKHAYNKYIITTHAMTYMVSSKKFHFSSEMEQHRTIRKSLNLKIVTTDVKVGTSINKYNLTLMSKTVIKAFGGSGGEGLKRLHSFPPLSFEN